MPEWDRVFERSHQLRRAHCQPAPPLTDEQRIALGLRPRTLHGWWFWCRYWSPVARAVRAAFGSRRR